MIVVDSSAMVDALIADPADTAFLATLAVEEIHVPALLDFEVTSALRALLVGRKLGPDRVDTALRNFGQMSITRHHMTSWLSNLMRMRDAFTAYDAAYVVLSQALAAPLVTSDRKMRVAERFGVPVRVVSGAGA